MSKRRSPPENKCPECRIHKSLCFCDLVSLFDNRVRVTIIMHHREEHLTSNTAVLTARVLKNASIVKRGLPEKFFSLADLDIKSDEVPLFLFPSEEARTIDDDFLVDMQNKKIHLIIPDGTWNQAKKVYRREKELHHIPLVKLDLSGLHSSQYLLRKSPRSDGLCTFEAIAFALKKLESEEVFHHMDFVFSTMVKRFLKARTHFYD